MIARPRLHEKLYCFSHPSPVAFVGSFNLSSDSPEDEPEVIEIIGDQTLWILAPDSETGDAIREALAFPAERAE